MEQRWSTRAGEAGDPRENPPTSGIVANDAFVRKLGVIQPGIKHGDERSSHCATAAPRITRASRLHCYIYTAAVVIPPLATGVVYAFNRATQDSVTLTLYLHDSCENRNTDQNMLQPIKKLETPQCFQLQSRGSENECRVTYSEPVVCFAFLIPCYNYKPEGGPRRNIRTSTETAHNDCLIARRRKNCVENLTNVISNNEDSKVLAMIEDTLSGRVKACTVHNCDAGCTCAEPRLNGKEEMAYRHSAASSKHGAPSQAQLFSRPSVVTLRTPTLQLHYPRDRLLGRIPEARKNFLLPFLDCETNRRAVLAANMYWSDYSLPTMANVRFDFWRNHCRIFRTWESCRTMPLVDGFSRGSPVSPALAFRRRSILTSLHPARQPSLLGTLEYREKILGPAVFHNSLAHIQFLDWMIYVLRVIVMSVHVSHRRTVSLATPPISKTAGKSAVLKSNIHGNLFAKLGCPYLLFFWFFFSAEKRGSYKDHTGTGYNSVIATTCRALNWRADKISFKHVYTDVTFAIGSQFIRHAVDDSEPIPDFMEQRRNEGVGEAEYPRVNPLTNDIVRYDSDTRKSGVGRPGMEPGSTWWEACRLTPQPPLKDVTGNPRVDTEHDDDVGYNTASRRVALHSTRMFLFSLAVIAALGTRASVSGTSRAGSVANCRHWQVELEIGKFRKSSAYWSLSCVFIGCCPTTGGYGIRKLFPCKSATGSEACRAGIINYCPIAKFRTTPPGDTLAMLMRRASTLTPGAASRDWETDNRLFTPLPMRLFGPPIARDRRVTARPGRPNSSCKLASSTKTKTKAWITISSPSCEFPPIVVSLPPVALREKSFVETMLVLAQPN
ncbi:hypothetical protein PR048_022969 [Dryococelus australis]|uniref:Uncharacterized protein n=1 Tax=Dryococelus australis TaxID=614101 RepID=A0ABQ9GSV3_9NEOP|nr:hypothetical protein PR048_022969 [Dryococelus australis]